MQNIHLEHHPMFVTSAYTTYVQDIDNSKITEHVNYLDNNVPNVRRQRSNAGGFQTTDIYPMPFDFDETEKLFAQWIQPAVGTILNGWNVPHDINSFSYWYNLNPKFTYNREHIHANSLVSGVYYIKVPKDSGQLVFHRTDATAFLNLYDFYKTLDTCSTFKINPCPGMLVVFPASFTHSVEQNMSEEPRVSVAFNFKITGAIK